MDVLDKFFIKYSYKFPKGYPDMNNEQDILLLESILKELNIGLSLKEAKTTATEDLHEIFTAMFVAGHKPVSKEKFYITDWDKEVNLSKLNKQSLHSDVIKSYIGKDKIQKPEYYKLYQDAQLTASQINSKLGYPSGLIGVERVFGSGDSGKKIKADIISYQTIDGFKDKVDISLYKI